MASEISKMSAVPVESGRPWFRGVSSELQADSHPYSFAGEAIKRYFTYAYYLNDILAPYNPFCGLKRGNKISTPFFSIDPKWGHGMCDNATLCQNYKLKMRALTGSLLLASLTIIRPMWSTMRPQACSFFIFCLQFFPNI